MELQFPIYLDYQATTPPDPRVVEAMLPYWNERFGNPHARGHKFGWQTEEAVEMAREQVAQLIGASAKEVVFTSGATESNNLAIKGIARAYQEGKKKHLVTVATEHKCVKESFSRLAGEGFEVTVLPVGPNGLLDMERVAGALREDTLLLSVMAVNNEIGVIQPLEDLGALCRERGVLFHCDAAQGFGKIPLDVERMNIAAMSISGHKVYGPQGIGALYLRRRPRVALEPLFDGGGQERGLRSGTVPVALAAGLGKAAEVASQEMMAERDRLKECYDLLLSLTVDAHEGITLNGDRERRFPGNINLGFAGVRGDSVLLALKKLALSSGSACASASGEPSYVLEAIGVPKSVAHASIRLGLGRFTTKAEVEYAAQSVVEAYAKLKKEP